MGHQHVYLCGDRVVVPLIKRHRLPILVGYFHLQGQLLELPLHCSRPGIGLMM